MLIRQTRVAASILLAIVAPAQALDSSGGVTVIGQMAEQQRELSLSADWILEADLGPGRWLAYAEYSSTPRADGVSAAYPQANADAGSALDVDGQGRLQLSELHYGWALSPAVTLTGGLMDTGAFMDRSRITNDETRHFLGAAFVNNPTIAFPDYTLGLALDAPLADSSEWGGAVLVARARGLADDPSHAYSQLLSQEHGSGWFGAAVLRHRASWGQWRLGAWHNSRRSEALDGRSPPAEGRGVFAGAGTQWRGRAFNLRAGIADRRVSEVERFASAAVLQPWGAQRLGLAWARSWPSSSHAGVHAAATQVEAFVRWQPGDESLQISPGVQWLDNPELRPAPAVWVASLRLQWNW